MEANRGKQSQNKGNHRHSAHILQVRYCGRSMREQRWYESPSKLNSLPWEGTSTIVLSALEFQATGEKRLLAEYGFCNSRQQCRKQHGKLQRTHEGSLESSFFMQVWTRLTDSEPA